jgi:hypothetical protein
MLERWLPARRAYTSERILGLRGNFPFLNFRHGDFEREVITSVIGHPYTLCNPYVHKMYGRHK